jgi:hypothetical protein
MVGLLVDGAAAETSCCLFVLSYPQPPPATPGSSQRSWSDTASVQTLERHHWLNTLVGMIDGAFHLTDEEQYFTIDIVRRLLDALGIPGRSVPRQIPAAVALEVAAGHYTEQIRSGRDAQLTRLVREATERDLVVSIEAWSQALVSLLLSAYPDLHPMERVVITKVFADLLAALGLPDRVATHFPDSVIRAYLSQQV